MANRDDHFLKAHLYPSEIDAGHGLLDIAATEDEPRSHYEEDVRAIYAAASALWRKNTGYLPNMHQPRFEKHLPTKEDRQIWGTSIMEMRKAALDGEVTTIPERATLLAAIVAFKEDIRDVRDFDEQDDNQLDLSNNALLIYQNQEASKEIGSEDWSKLNLKMVTQGNFKRIPDHVMPVFERMVSPEGMDQKLRNFAMEAGKASEKITLGWGLRTLESNLNVDDHSLAQIHREIGRRRLAGITMARQQGMGM